MQLPATTLWRSDTSGWRPLPEDEILDRALLEQRVIISHDTDFGTLLAIRGLARPSFVLIRSSDPLSTDEIARLLLANFDTMAADLNAGAIVTFARGHLRARRLPVR